MVSQTINTNTAVTQQLVQIGILVATLGGVLSLIGLYPGITGVEPKSGIGVLQIFIILGGMSLIILGALIFIKLGFYNQVESNLAQRIAIRLCLTGLLFAAAVGLSDILGYGSNPPIGDESPILGTIQAIGMILGFIIASSGVLLFLLAGPIPETKLSFGSSWTLTDATRTTDTAIAVSPQMLENYEQTLAVMVREIQPTDANKFLILQRQLDRETKFMMLEDGERQTTSNEQLEMVHRSIQDPNQVIFVAEHQQDIVGYLGTVSGEFQRNHHTAQIVIGIMQEFTRQGIGTRLFEALERWAKTQSIHRLELTVMATNKGGIALYKKMGFEIEGTKKHSLNVDGQFVDELYMAKLLS